MNQNIFTKTSLLFGVSSALLFIGGCSKKSSTTSDSNTTSAIAADSAQEVADGIADDSSTSSSFAAEYTEAYAPSSLSTTRTCSGGGSAGTAVTVGITFSGSQTISLTRPKVSVSSEITETGTLSRVWTPPSTQTIACNAGATRVLFNWANDSIVNGLKVTQTVDRTRNASRTVTVTSSGASVVKTNNFTAKGTRTVTWATGSGTSGSTVSRTKTVTSDVTRTATVTNADGTTSTVNSTVTIADSTPLSVTVVRASTAPYALKTKTISSGTVTATRTGVDRVESAYTDVVYDMTSSTPCLPTSGTITVKYFSSDTATTAASTSTITFGASTDSGVSITPEGGTATDYPEYNSTGCDLEKEV
ncbi:MAG: hypothetical protein JST16_05810 [Bdellovibrionales bacterium]|nr:hypothetical protein [Bdellovibrionales bacterium]